MGIVVSLDWKPIAYHRLLLLKSPSLRIRFRRSFIQELFALPLVVAPHAATAWLVFAKIT